MWALPYKLLKGLKQWSLQWYLCHFISRDFFFLLWKLATFWGEMRAVIMLKDSDAQQKFQFRSLTGFLAVQFKYLLGICISLLNSSSSEQKGALLPRASSSWGFANRERRWESYSSFPELCCHLPIKLEASPNESLLGQRLATFSLLFPERTVES